MPTKSRSIAFEFARATTGWVFLVLFLAMVALWTVFGFSPQTIGKTPEPFSAFGDVSQWWPILAGVAVGAIAAWALKPGLRIGSDQGGGDSSVPPWAAVVLGVSALVMMFSAYWPCAGNEAQVWSALRQALESFEGYAVEPFGSVAGCPAEMPQTLVAGVLFGKATLLLVAGLALLKIFGDTHDRIRARLARRVVVFSGVSDETLDMLRTIATELTPRQTLLVLDGGPGLARAREAVRDIRREFARQRARANVFVLPLDAADSDAVEAFARSRAKYGIRGLYLMSPDSASNLRALESLMPRERSIEPEPSTEVPGRVVVRVDNPWHAEDWRRKQMVGRPGWLFDALSVREIAARHVVSRLKQQGVDYVVISAGTSFSLALLAELTFEQRLDDCLSKISDEAKAKSTTPDRFADFVPRTPKAVLVGRQANDIAEHFRDQLKRFGIDHSHEIVGLRRFQSAEAAMSGLIDDGQKPALIVDSESGNDSGTVHDATFAAVRHPRWTIFNWDQSVRGITDEPLLGRLWMVGPTLKPVPDIGLDIWDRLGAVQHMAYVLRNQEGRFVEDPTHKHGLWKSLDAFPRESNIRTFATFTRAVQNLPDGPRRLGTDLGPSGTETEAPIESHADFNALAKSEHDSWKNHHEEYGFRLGTRGRRKRHPDMVDWSVLPPEVRKKDEDNVAVTNDLLRALGFIMVRAKSRYQRVPHRVRAELLPRAWRWSTASGERMVARPGDYRLTDPQTGTQWSSSPTALAAGYALVGDAVYESSGTVMARCVDASEEPIVVESLEGPEHANPGDWIVEDADGNGWVVKPEIFAQRYRVADDQR